MIRTSYIAVTHTFVVFCAKRSEDGRVHSIYRPGSSYTEAHVFASEYADKGYRVTVIRDDGVVSMKIDPGHGRTFEAVGVEVAS